MIIVTYNSAEVIEGCVSSVRSLMPMAQIIVVDNASTEAMPDLRPAGVTVIANRDNAGYGRACNQGAEEATGSHLLFLNPDVRLTDVDLDALEVELGARPIGLVAPVLRHGKRGMSASEHWTRALLRHVIGPLRPRGLPRLPQVVVDRGSWCPVGAALLVSRAEFAHVGGFDRRFFLYYEDLDLARRYRTAGLPVRTTRSIAARHRRGRSSAGEASSAQVRAGWSYLSWLEYLCTWNGRATAVRAARSARVMGRCTDRALALLERFGPTSSRATRKRCELAELDAFVRRQAGFGAGAAAPDFCPRAREIVASVGRWPR